MVELHQDGVTGNNLRSDADKKLFSWIDQDHSVEGYGFWETWADKKNFLKSVGKRFRDRHGKR
jgi:hypothetical protein